MEDVARFVGYSYYHLTRQFAAVLGESIGSYIKGRRLADAAKKLLYTNGRVINLAIEDLSVYLGDLDAEYERKAGCAGGF